MKLSSRNNKYYLTIPTADVGSHLHYLDRVILRTVFFIKFEYSCFIIIFPVACIIFRLIYILKPYGLFLIDDHYDLFGDLHIFRQREYVCTSCDHTNIELKVVDIPPTDTIIDNAKILRKILPTEKTKDLYNDLTSDKNYIY